MASLAIGAPTKWTDNVLSQQLVPGIVTERRGVARKIPHAALLVLALARELHADAGLSVRDAIAMAPRLLESGGDGVLASGHLRVSLDREAFERDLTARLRHALESAPVPRRGRPPQRPARR